MKNIPEKKLLKEPPGPRRVLLALGNQGKAQQDVADTCNCDNSTVSRVVGGKNSTELHQRIRGVIVKMAGMEEAWLFTHGDSPIRNHTSSAIAQSSKV